MRVSCFLALAVGLILLGTPGFAHHGTGVSYDASKPVTLKGTVTEFRYANPHPQLYFDVTDEKGNVAHWSGEFYPNPAQLAQGGQRGIPAADPQNANKPYDRHDLSGIWTRNGTPGGYGGGGTCRDCGDRGFGNDVPPFTPLGQKMFDANKPSYGRNLGSADAAAHPEEHIGRRRAVPPSNGTDPYQYCNPMGPSRALIYPDPLEFIVLPDRIYH